MFLARQSQSMGSAMPMQQQQQQPSPSPSPSRLAMNSQTGGLMGQEMAP